MFHSFEITFTEKQRSAACEVRGFEVLEKALKELGLDKPRPVLVLTGGAGNMSSADVEKIRRLMLEGLIPLLETLGIAVVDGGTDSGIFRLLGEARAERGAKFPLVGVNIASLTPLPDNPVERTPLEPNHTHFVLVPGDERGDEIPWMVKIGTLLSQGLPSVTLLINGGEVAFRDVAGSLAAGRPVVVLAGSGRAADIFAGTLRGELNDMRAAGLVGSGMVKAVDVVHGPQAFARALETYFVDNSERYF